MDQKTSFAAEAHQQERTPDAIQSTFWHASTQRFSFETTSYIST